MFERYTEKARRVIFFARYEALQYGSIVISPEHILLGLMREDKTVSARFFPFRNSLTVEAVRREVEERIVLRERIPQSAELHLATETKRILALANEESRQLQNRHIGPEHLLLGLVREERSIAAEILYQYGLRLQD
ncbi:MAG: ATP-dependent Clp protease ATP-binding subunit ClpC, partial [Acidobacteria bacterium]|nr:ATP-dependent Clp protease ATP-binding subunit ClpC [Acidobacteriota bacterium]